MRPTSPPSPWWIWGFHTQTIWTNWVDVIVNFPFIGRYFVPAWSSEIPARVILQKSQGIPHSMLDLTVPMFLLWWKPGSGPWSLTAAESPTGVSCVGSYSPHALPSFLHLRSSFLWMIFSTVTLIRRWSGDESRHRVGHTDSIEMNACLNPNHFPFGPRIPFFCKIFCHQSLPPPKKYYFVN